MKLLHINQILDDCEDFGYINCDRDGTDSIEFESIIHYLKEYKVSQAIIKDIIRLTDKVDDMESARDLYDLVMDIKNRLQDSDK